MSESTVAIDDLRADMAQTFERAAVVSRGAIAAESATAVAMWLCTEFATTGEIAAHFACSTRAVRRAVAIVETDIEEATKLGVLSAALLTHLRRVRADG